VSARLTIDTSNELDANPTHGRHSPIRNSHQMPNEAIVANSVTMKPATCIPSRGSVRMLYVGAIIRSAIATARTRATTYSPSMPAAASDGSGRDQIG
jgi:hypothetical protein